MCRACWGPDPGGVDDRVVPRFPACMAPVPRPVQPCRRARLFPAWPLALPGVAVQRDQGTGATCTSRRHVGFDVRRHPPGRHFPARAVFRSVLVRRAKASTSSFVPGTFLALPGSWPRSRCAWGRGLFGRPFEARACDAHGEGARTRDVSLWMPKLDGRRPRPRGSRRRRAKAAFPANCHVRAPRGFVNTEVRSTGALQEPWDRFRECRGARSVR